MDRLASGCLGVSATTGMPGPHLLAHALLFASSVVGGSVFYQVDENALPRSVGVSTTILTEDDKCPVWFHAATGKALETQRGIDRWIEKKRARIPRPTEIDAARKLVTAYGPCAEILPLEILKAMDGGAEIFPPEAHWFLHDTTRKGTIRELPGWAAYGPHFLAYAEGVECYRDLLGNTCRRDSLYAAAAQASDAVNVNIHGWAEFSSTVKLFRKEGVERMPSFGLLMKFPALGPQPFHSDERCEYYLEFFDAVLWMRLGPGYCFQPGPEIAELLQAEVEEQRKRSNGSGISEEAANPVPMLPWNIAALLRALGGDIGVVPENSSSVAVRACRIARFIHQLHLHTMGRIFPIEGNGNIDPMAAMITDKLSVGSLTSRELTRKIHRMDAQNLRIRLEFLERKGMACRDPDGKWKLEPFEWENFADLVEPLSAES